jgi:hypothetical protein
LLLSLLQLHNKRARRGSKWTAGKMRLRDKRKRGIKGERHEREKRERERQQTADRE